jgi:hypothetical protein
MDLNGTISIWDWAAAKEIRSFSAAGLNREHGIHLAYAPDGKSLATAYVLGFDAAPAVVVKLWDPATGKELHTVRVTSQ